MCVCVWGGGSNLTKGTLVEVRLGGYTCVSVKKGEGDCDCCLRERSAAISFENSSAFPMGWGWGWMRCRGRGLMQEQSMLLFFVEINSYFRGPKYHPFAIIHKMVLFHSLFFRLNPKEFTFRFFVP